MKIFINVGVIKYCMIGNIKNSVIEVLSNEFLSIIIINLRRYINKTNKNALFLLKYHWLKYQTMVFLRKKRNSQKTPLKNIFN